MTTASTSTVIDHTSNTGFQNWVTEIVTMLFTTLGVTQTADTGQINPATVTRPAVNTMAGYVIGEFNDTLNSSSPLFFKIQFGTANSAAVPAMSLQIGTGSNGSGTLTGPTTLATFMTNSTLATSTTTPYITRACYNATDGVLWLSWKLNGASQTNVSLGGFLIARSNNSSGVATGDGAIHVSNASVTTGGAASTGSYLQAISYLNSTAYNSGLFPSAAWGVIPMNLTASLFSGNTQVGPCFQYTPAWGISNWYAIGIVGEIAVGSTTSLTLIGTTAHTYISAGSPFGTNILTNNNVGSGYQANGGAATTYTVLLPWE
jgi:hypothetical protein